MSKSLAAAFGDRRNFVIYRKADKTPVDPFTQQNSNAQDLATHLTLPVALGCAAMLGEGYGVGIVIHEGSQLFAIDLDGCLAGGALTPTAYGIVQQYRKLGAYIEVSMSGRGVHIIGTCTGPLAPHRCKNKEHHLEMYTSARYIALTGNALGGDPLGDARVDCTAALWATVQAFFLPDVAEGPAAEWTTEPLWHVPGTADDEKLIEKAKRSKSARAMFGDGVTFASLWDADADKLGKEWPGKTNGYDASSARMSLANRMIWWTGGNCERTEQLMRQSKIAEGQDEKWNRLLRSEILKALAFVSKNPPTDRNKPTPAAASPPPGTVPPPPPGATNPLIDSTAAVEAEPLPQARHLATDQRNVDRIIAAYGTRLLSVGGKLYAWSGRHWEPDTGLARRFAGNLSRIVAEERERAEAQFKELEKSPDANGEKLMMLKSIMASLVVWGPKCEMAATQNAALKMLIEAVKIDADKLDADPLLINLENGTYNVRTGKLQPHNPLDYITKVAPVKFDASATCPRFDQFLLEVFDGNGELIGFVLRWFGYCATGETKEQFVVIHWGHGANGKGTLIKTIAAILGDYAGAGAPGLLTAKNEDQRHPAEIADLFGKRMVTCSESDEGATLREGFVKQASGEDKMKGRFLHAQFFEFNPTHKLQLQTNKKPVVKGTDHGMWRRLLMLPYLNIFGTADEIATGKANKLRDNDLDAALKAEWTGILNRILQGAADWLRVGLKPPAAVLDASEAYRQEQDLIGEFVREELTLDLKARTDSKLLYAHYTAWNSGGGTKHLPSKAFVAELEKHVPGFRRVKSGGTRWICGVSIGQPIAPPPPAKLP